jgi:hypothetical protein
MRFFLCTLRTSLLLPDFCPIFQWEAMLREERHAVPRIGQHHTFVGPNSLSWRQPHKSVRGTDFEMSRTGLKSKAWQKLLEAYSCPARGTIRSPPTGFEMHERVPKTWVLLQNVTNVLPRIFSLALRQGEFHLGSENKYR